MIRLECSTTKVVVVSFGVVVTSVVGIEVVEEYIELVAKVLS